MPQPSIKIENGVPLPTKRYHRGKWKDMLEAMKLRDSFAIPVSAVPSVRIAVAKHKQRNKVKKDWVVRKNGPAEWRCWRIK